MAWTQHRNGSYRVLFRYKGHQHTIWLGEVSDREAEKYADKVDYWLMRLKQNLVSLPPACKITDFIEHDGKPPEHIATPHSSVAMSLAELRDAYLKSQQHKLEQNTLDSIRLHFNHLTRILGTDVIMMNLSRADLQRYVTSRSQEWIDPNVYRRHREAKLAEKPKRNWKRKHEQEQTVATPQPEKPKRHPSSATIRKEIVSLRTAWNWARRQWDLAKEFPGKGLDFAKTQEALPYMTWEEATRRVQAGDDPEIVWESVYLQRAEIDALLADVQGRAVSHWVYPMFCFAAHTGTRRSEIARATLADLDLESGSMTIREKKRDKAKFTLRRVPLSPFLASVLKDWRIRRGSGKTLFCKDDGAAITPREMHNYFQRAVKTTKWNVLKGWHVFRHSFISALASKGIDQRTIDEMVGHSTEEQRRRYRHLYPDVAKRAVQDVFG